MRLWLHFWNESCELLDSIVVNYPDDRSAHKLFIIKWIDENWPGIYNSVYPNGGIFEQIDKVTYSFEGKLSFDIEEELT